MLLNKIDGIEEEGRDLDELGKELNASDRQDSDPDEGQKDTDLPPSGEEKPEGDKPPQDGDNNPDDNNVPFHKHPRWQALNDENQRLREAVDELTTFKTELESRFKEKEQDDSDAPIPDWFKNTFGEDPETWKQYHEYEKGLREKIKQELIADDISSRRMADETAKQWTDWFDRSISVMLSDGKHDTFTKEELMEVVKDYNPTMYYQGQTIPDLEKAYQILELKRKSTQAPNREKVQEKKRLADISNDSGKPNANPNQDFKTSKDLRSKSFFDLISG